MSSRSRLKPKDYAPPGAWPVGPFDRMPAAGTEHDQESAAHIAPLVAALEERRERLGLSVRRLAMLAAMSPTTVGNTLSGMSWPDGNTLGRLLWVLDSEGLTVRWRRRPEIG